MMPNDDFRELLGTDAQLLDIGAATVALVLLFLIARFVYRTGGLRLLLAFVFAAIYGAALVPLP